MLRRRFLAGVGAAMLAGCTEESVEVASETREPTRTSTATATATATESPTATDTATATGIPTPEGLGEAREKLWRYLRRRVDSVSVSGNIEVTYFTEVDTAMQMKIEISMVVGGYEKIAEEYEGIEDLEATVRKGMFGGKATYQCKREWAGKDDTMGKVYDTFQAE